MKFGIYRRDPRGKWTEVEPNGIEQLGLIDAIHYYEKTYAHDDVDGTEVMFSFVNARGVPRIVMRKVEARLVPMHWDES